MSPTEKVIECIHKLLDDDVIENTYRIMINLRDHLNLIEMTHDEQLRSLLLRLSSESIREALHKRELHITNAIIEAKNRILKASNIQIPEGHEMINMVEYNNYTW